MPWTLQSREHRYKTSVVQLPAPVSLQCGQPPPPPPLIATEAWGIGVPLWVDGHIVADPDNPDIYYWYCHPYSERNAFAGEGDEYMILQANLNLNDQGLGTSGMYRVRVRVWGLCEVRRVTGSQPDGTNVLDFGPIYLSPALYDFLSLPRMSWLNEDEENNCGLWGRGPMWEILGSVNAQTPAVMVPYKVVSWLQWNHNEQPQCGWYPEGYFGTTTDEDLYALHGHPVWTGALHDSMESAYRSGSTLYGGCARPQSFVGVVPLKLRTDAWNFRPSQLLGTLDAGLNLYTIGIYNRATSQVEELWTVNTFNVPRNPGDSAHPNLILPNWQNIAAVAWNGFARASLRIHIIDHEYEFMVSGGQKSLVMRVDTDDIGTGVVLPSIVSQMFAHAGRWQRLRQNPAWASNPFVAYMNNTNKPHDWLWPRRTDPPGESGYKDINWYATNVIGEVNVASAVSAANAIPQEQWRRCWNERTNESEPITYGPDIFISFMQSIVVVGLSIEAV